MMRYFIIYAWGNCPFCLSTKELLEEKGEHYMMVYLDHDDTLLEYLKKLYEWETVPLILLHDIKTGDQQCGYSPCSTATLVGGYTDLIKHLEGQ